MKTAIFLSLIVSLKVSSGSVFLDDNGNGAQDFSEKGLPGIVVSNGRDVCRTGIDGSFTLTPSNSPFIFLCKPAEYRLTTPFYVPASQAGQAFGLQKYSGIMDRSQSVSFAQIADSEAGDCQFLNAEFLAAKTNFGFDFLVHSGDIGNLANHKKGLGALGIPVHYSIGNHDFSRDSDSGELPFEQVFGPLYYSFDEGPVHFVVLGLSSIADKAPRKTMAEDQFTWLQNDLAQVDSSRPVVAFRHVPCRNNDGGKLDPFRLLDKRALLAVSGHSHNTQARREAGRPFSIESSPPSKGGIDHSPRSFRIISIAPNGEIQVKTRLLGIQYHVAAIAPGQVSAYHTGCPVKSVTWQTENQQKIPLKANGDWLWDAPAEKNRLSGKFTVTVAFSDGKIIERSGDMPSLQPGMAKAGADWPMFRKDPQRSGCLPDGPQPPLQLAWVYPAGNPIAFNSPVVAGGKLFIGTLDDDLAKSAGILALEAETGNFLWKFNTGNSLKHSLAVGHDAVYAVTVTGQVFAVSQSNGILLWNCLLPDVASSDGLHSNPGLLGDTLFIASDTLYALNCHSGEIRWQQSKKTAPGAPSYAGPLLSDDNNRIFCQSNWRRGVYAYDSQSGELLWNQSQTPFFTYLDSPPVFFQNRLYLKMNKALRILDSETGTIVLEQAIPGRYTESASTPLRWNNLLIAGMGSAGLQAFDLQTLGERWQFLPGSSMVATTPYGWATTALSTVEGSPVASADTLFAGACDGKFYAIDAKNGRKLWEFDLGAPTYTTPALSGNMVFMSALNGNIFGFAGNTP